MNTVWVAKVGPGCNDSLKFQKNGGVKIYECEAGVTIHGSYTFSKDTLIITEKDDSHPEDNSKIMYFRVKYAIRKNYLYPIKAVS
ncbi:MAG: hypothetical protein JWR02_1404 [Mucilaginibacter sp.]|nr:hypothetical protein [Mucilaginibacter sp.]